MSFQAVYLRIIETAGNIKDFSTSKLESLPFDAGQQESSPNLPTLCISPSATPLSTLLAEGIPFPTAQRLVDRLDKSLHSLRQTLEDGFKETWSKILKTPRHETMVPLDELHQQLYRTYQSLYDTKAMEWLNQIRRNAQARLPTLDKDKGLQAEVYNDRKPVFNQNYLPVLEAFFNEEPFPSRVDKLYLAKKSGMSFRQIHVWFQNRRSRSKKVATDPGHVEGGNLRHPSDTEVEDEHWKEDNSISSSRSSSVTLVSDDSSLLAVSTYTFPTKYPPQFSPESDPFPCRFGDFSIFSKPVWERKPMSEMRSRKDPCIDSMVEAFSRLEITQMSPLTEQQSERPHNWGLSKGTNSINCSIATPCTTRPLSAPLSSLILNPSRHVNLRPCVIFRPPNNTFPSLVTKRLSTHASQVPPIISYAPTTTSTCDPQFVGTKIGTKELDNVLKHSCRTRQGAKKSGLPRRIPIGHPKNFARVDEKHAGVSRSADSGHAFVAPSEDTLGDYITSCASHHSASSESFMLPSSSSCSSSETHSPPTPIQSFTEENSVSSWDGREPPSCDLLYQTSGSSVSPTESLSSNFMLNPKAHPDTLIDFSFPLSPFSSQSQLYSMPPFSFDFTSS